MKVEFLAAAEREFRDASRYYETRVPGLGQEFVVELERASSLLAERNALGRRCDSRHRRLGLRRFPFAIVYRIHGAVIQIVAVAHKRRRPEYWVATYVRDVAGNYAVELAA